LRFIVKLKIIFVIFETSLFSCFFSIESKNVCFQHFVKSFGAVFFVAILILMRVLIENFCVK